MCLPPNPSFLLDRRGGGGNQRTQLGGGGNEYEKDQHKVLEELR